MSQKTVVIPEYPEKVEVIIKELLKIFFLGRKEGKKNKKWIAYNLKKRGVVPEYARRISKFEGITNKLFTLNPRLINKAMDSLIKEFVDNGFRKDVAL